MLYKMVSAPPGKATFEFKNKREFISCAASVVFSGIRILSRLWIRKEFTYVVSIRKEHKLCTNGPYAWVRNPGYLGTLGNVFCDAIYWNSKGLYAYAMYMALSVYLRMNEEEAALSNEFKEEWDNYVQKTPCRLIPFLY